MGTAIERLIESVEDDLKEATREEARKLAAMKCARRIEEMAEALVQHTWAGGRREALSDVLAYAREEAARE